MDEHTSGWGIIRHTGIHNHQWPRRAKPDKLSLNKFGQRVVNNPEIGPLRHKVCTYMIDTIDTHAELTL